MTGSAPRPRRASAAAVAAPDKSCVIAGGGSE
jgi:hypothetical protein